MLLTMVWIYFNYSVMPLLFNSDLGHIGTTAGSLEGQSGCPIFNHVFEQTGNHIFEQTGDNAANINFQVLWLLLSYIYDYRLFPFLLKLN